MHPRERIGHSLVGDVLEIGPGSEPVPTGPETRVTYADKPVQGGRDATWPELAGTPRGPDADVELDLDVDGLAAFDDGSFDAVIGSHLIEHLANPVSALREFRRVLRPGGRLVLMVPDRLQTFDHQREPTPTDHVLGEFERDVTEVSEEHIREFCEAIWAQETLHSPEVRDWHDPERLDDERLELHRRRSIHVHCWTPEEFVVLLAATVMRGLGSWRFADGYFLYTNVDPVGVEFGIVLERLPGTGDVDAACALLKDWGGRAVEEPNGLDRLIALQAAAARDLTGDEARRAVSTVGDLLIDQVVAAQLDAKEQRRVRSVLEGELADFGHRVGVLDGELHAYRSSRAHRFTEAIVTRLRRLRRT